MKKFAFISAIVFSTVLNAQVDTIARDSAAFHVNTTTPMTVFGQVKVRYVQTAARRDVPDSTLARLFPAGNLSDLLSGSGLMTLKSYSPGGLATTSLRGANSMQTPVFWNGINLQNINNNTVDLSLVPSFLFDYASVSPGGTSAAFGNGAIGGAIQVNSWAFGRINGYFVSEPYFKTRLVSETGSFGTYMNGIQLGYGKQKWHFDVRTYRQQAKNNFTYQNAALTGNPVEELQHANFLQHGALFKAAYRSTDFNKFLGLQVWVQETQREIPPTMLQSENKSTQQDYALRILLEGQRSYNDPNKLLQAQLAVIHEGLLYDPGYSLQTSNTDAWRGILTATYTRYFNHHKRKLLQGANLKSGIMLTGSTSKVTEFIPETQQLRSAAFVSYSKYLRSDDEFNITIRQELVNDEPVDPVGNIWYYFVLKDWIAFRACVSHNYRVPTFNDLYWRPGGNPDLEAETSWTEELSVELGKKWNRTAVSYSVTGYNRSVKNMITWVPLAAYWSPVNVAEVWSRGVEHRFRFTHSMSWVKITVLANVDYVRSTYEKSEITNDVSIGKQLIYVPAWFGSGSITLDAKGIFITYSQSYTDLRFTTRDHVEWLPAYSIGNAAVGYSFDPKKNGKERTINVFFRCNNIADVQYQAVAWRPMPGRNYAVGLSITFGQTIKNQNN